MTSNLFYNEQIKQAMNKWGVSWFKFDESSGDVTDSKGSAIGIAYANTTRVTGWNGEGYAMKFNGTSTSYIQFDNKVIPNGTYTLRFKMKLFTPPTAENQEIFSNAYATADHAGLRVWLSTGDGSMTFTATRKVSNKYDFMVNFSPSYDGQWHDYMMAWDTVNQVVRVYVDNVLIRESSSVTKNTLTATYNLKIGRQAVSAEGRYFNGELDDVQIYNKALTPLDFILNKTLILNKNEYKTYNSGWQTVSTTTPPESQFLSDGIDDLLTLERKVQSLPSIKMDKSEILLNNEGKVFSKTLDLKKYMDIRNIKAGAK